MPAAMPKRKPDRFLSIFAPVLSPRANNNRVIMSTLTKYLSGLSPNDGTGIRLRRFLKEVNGLFGLSRRKTSLHCSVNGANTILWAHEEHLAPSLEVSCSIPTTTLFTSMRKDLV